MGTFVMIERDVFGQGEHAPKCACGCGSSVRRNRAGVFNNYLHGHSRRGQSPTEEHRRKISVARTGQPGPWLGKKLSADSRAKMSAAKKGSPLTAEHRKKIACTMVGKPHPSIHHKQSVATKLKKSLAQRGEKGSNWQGGISSENACSRASAAYREWRITVFRRDRFTCQDCGSRSVKGAHPDLHAHHIQPFSKFPELRFEIDNGVTLCGPCHGARHFGGVKGG